MSLEDNEDLPTWVPEFHGKVTRIWELLQQPKPADNEDLVRAADDLDQFVDQVLSSVSDPTSGLEGALQEIAGMGHILVNEVIPPTGGTTLCGWMLSMTEVTDLLINPPA